MEKEMESEVDKDFPWPDHKKTKTKRKTPPHMMEKEKKLVLAYSGTLHLFWLKYMVPV